MRAALVTQWFDPEPGSAALAAVIARALVAEGIDVEVLTGFPNYPTGRLAPGYRVLPYQREHRDGLVVHRSPLWPSHDSSPLNRAANYLSYSCGATAVGLSKLRGIRASLVLSSPITAALPALAMKWRWGVPYLLHVQDMWPQSVTSSGFLGVRSSRFATAALHRLCDLIYRNAAHIAVTSPGMRGLIEERGVPSSKLSVVTNWTDESAFRPVPADPALRDELGIDRRFTVMYAGNFGAMQALDLLLEASRRLRHRRDIGFALVGGGILEDRIRATMREPGGDNITLVGQQPFERIADVLALGDAHFVGLVDVPVLRTTMPSKLQGTLCAGKPVIGALTGDAADVVRRSGAGAVVDPSDVTGLVREIEQMSCLTHRELTRMGCRGREYYRTHFSEDVSAAALAARLREIAGEAA